ncbi:MAG: pyridoxal phosphate-dependent aminotransferase [Desulfobacteraceae bacterium]|nr:pyridoxal phosphate-dependent aminotransferase [Desulfobacteraceae bacterium]
MRFSPRMQAVAESQTTRLMPVLERLRRQGRDIVSLAVGEPEYPTPAEIVTATCRAAQEGHTRYGPVAGLPRLRERLAQDFPGWGPENIVVSNGAKQCLFQLFQILCGPGDEVLLPRPGWVSFAEQIRLAGARPVFVDCPDHQINPDRMSAAVTAKTRVVLLNSPNNPTGAVYAPSRIAAVADLCRTHDLVLISDEAYEGFVFDGNECVSAFAFPHIRSRLAVVRSFSKRFCMTGFRVGYAAASEALIREMVKLQSHATGNVCTFAQHGALAALSLTEDPAAAWREDLQRKRDLVFSRLSPIYPCRRPQGAFYFFLDVSSRLQEGETAADFAARLLDAAAVAVVPGDAFGVRDHIRVSYAVAEDRLVEALDRMEAFS